VVQEFGTLVQKDRVREFARELDTEEGVEDGPEV
jgi:hypothetical protein